MLCKNFEHIREKSLFYKTYDQIYIFEKMHKSKV